jgi:hypothetical protein
MGIFWSRNRLVSFRPLARPTARFLERGLQMSQKALMISGPLTDADVTELLDTLRKIEQAQGQIYRAVILGIVKNWGFQSGVG